MVFSVMCTFMTSNGPCKSILCSRWFDMLKWKQENELITEKKKKVKKRPSGIVTCPNKLFVIQSVYCRVKFSPNPGPTANMPEF